MVGYCDPAADDGRARQGLLIPGRRGQRLLRTSAGEGMLRVRLADPARQPHARQMLARLLGVPVQAAPDPAALSARVPAVAAGRTASEQVTAALAGLAGQGIAVGEFSFGQPSLDDVFLALTSHPGTATEASA
jgi:ABC-2 type transport system ATP-binding protein